MTLLNELISKIANVKYCKFIEQNSFHEINGFNYRTAFNSRKSEDGSTYFGGWARMAHPIEHFAVVEVAKPNIGETRPSRVRADVTVNLSVKYDVKAEWENLRKHDVCFLVTVKPPNSIGI